MSSTPPRVVIAGVGDTGLLSAIHLARHVDVVGISTKPGLLSGQELGMRLATPQRWARDYWVEFGRYRRLDRARLIHGEAIGLDPAERHVVVRRRDGAEQVEPYDVLVVATGVTNGFWRRPDVQTADEVSASLAAAHDRLASAGSVLVIGGGAAAVSSAFQLATRFPSTRVVLCFPGEAGLPQHSRRVWTQVSARLAAAGVELRAGHRAVVPEGFALDAVTDAPVSWSSGQEASTADAVVWAIGRVRPNTAWLPPELLDERGFVVVTPSLQLPGHPEIFAVGDVAATDPLRSSARNRADRLVARNIRAHLARGRLATFEPPRRRWGSVLGVEPDGLRVFAPAGRAFRFPGWSLDSVLQPWIVRRGIYRGVRR